MTESENEFNTLIDKSFRESTDELRIMLSILDPEHSIIVDENIGLIGEFEHTRDDIGLKPVVKDYDSNIKCGDYFQVLGKQGLVVLEEKVIGVYRIISYNSVVTNKYMFILKDFKAKTMLQEMLGEEPGKAVVIYDADTEEYETNCIELANKFKFEKDIEVDYELCFTLSYNDETFYGLVVNRLNNIGILITR